MGFEFSLATVLRIRVIVEEREERMLQKILAEISLTRQKIGGVEHGLASSNGARDAELFQRLIGGHHHLSDGEVQGLQQSRKDLEIQIYKLEQLRDQQLKVYEAARRNREMLTDMQEEKHGAYDSDVVAA